MKRLISLILALTLICGLIPGALAASAPAASYNLDYHWYVNGQRWATPIYSYLAWENGQYVRAEYIGSDLVVEYYDQDFQFRSGKTIPLELPIFGGVRMDTDYNFVVVGQSNLEEKDSVEVFRIIRYTKDWKKVDHVSIYGANTYIPFDAGSLRFDRSGNILYIRTAHKMYTTDDGSNHQANVMIALRISDMTVTDSLTKIWNSSYGYVSHSFNQFVRVDGDTLLAVDHGDAYPRSVALFKYSKKAGSETFYGRTTMVNALPIANSAYHYNDTGVSVGGFEFSSSDYLIAGSAYDMSEIVDLMDAHRNIFVTATPKSDFTDEGTKLHWITNYTESDNVFVSPPHMLKLSADRFLLTWTENDRVKFCFLDGKGRLDGEIFDHEGNLSDCVPILAGNEAVWYVTSGGTPVFHTINVNTCSHNYAAAVTAPTCTAPGFTTYTCSKCGDSYVSDEATALGHSWQVTECTRCGITRLTLFDDVVPGSFYEPSVAWAVENGVTTGTTPTTFNPNGNCQRAAVVTFLWRAAGSPNPVSTENPFTDVTVDNFFYKAVLWAVEKGITNGTSTTEFSPFQDCTRAQVVTFLWRAQNCPESTAEISFDDVETGKFYTDAVAWAVENGITTGATPTTFNPNGICNRAQVVTFLDRTYK